MIPWRALMICLRPSPMFSRIFRGWQTTGWNGENQLLQRWLRDIESVVKRRARRYSAKSWQVWRLLVKIDQTSSLCLHFCVFISFGEVSVAGAKVYSVEEFVFCLTITFLQILWIVPVRRLWGPGLRWADSSTTRFFFSAFLRSFDSSSILAITFRDPGVILFFGPFGAFSVLVPVQTGRFGGTVFGLVMQFDARPARILQIASVLLISHRKVYIIHMIYWKRYEKTFCAVLRARFTALRFKDCLFLCWVVIFPPFLLD